jgi:hypothetical protein
VVASSGSSFQKVDLALRAPGESFLTRNINGPFIDTHLDFGIDGRPPFRGRVYIAVEELREMADQAGLFDEYKQAVHESQALLGEYEGRAYTQGYEDGQKETTRDDSELRDLLLDLADRLPGSSRAALEAAGVAVEDADGAVHDPSGNPFLVPLPAGEGAGAGRGKRPAGVSGNPSDELTSAVQ